SRGYQRWVGVAEQDPVHIRAKLVDLVQLSLDVVPAAKAVRLADVDRLDMDHWHVSERVAPGEARVHTLVRIPLDAVRVVDPLAGMRLAILDRKSTRLNSSHVKISYA